ncbi:DUF1707 SHOCT-like domain-containing protein [Micromonospora rhizosphaerae]|nr:DUF1707 domain-containing protein [Micromonospora rhizosphaerae]
MEGRGHLRAADTDRAATAERLRVAVEEGRLDLYEYDERLQRAYGAKTYAELDEVLADLPGPTPTEQVALARLTTGQSRPAGAAAEAVDHSGTVAVAGRARAVAVTGPVGRWLAQLWLPYLRVVGILTAIWIFSSIGAREAVFYWPLWVAGPWGVVLLFRTVGGLSAGEPRRVAERERRRRRKRKRRGREREGGAGGGDLGRKRRRGEVGRKPDGEDQPDGLGSTVRKSDQSAPTREPPPGPDGFAGRGPNEG